MVERRRAGSLRRRAWDVGYLLLGVAIATASAWIIYDNPRLAVVAVVGTVVGLGPVLLARWRRWPIWIAALIALVLYVIAVVPVAIPSALTSPIEVLRGVRDGLTGIVLGWKQLLTLSLPLGDYQAVLVPFLVVIAVGTFVAAALATADRFWSAGAALVVIAMTVFGLVFGSSATASPLVVGPVQIPAPRELLLGVLLLVVSAVWLLGRARLQRASALRAARAATVTQAGPSRALTFRRQLAGVLLVAVALGAGLAVAPVANALTPRQALRDRIDPLLVLSKQPSPLSAYRSYFEGDAFDDELFTVTGADGIDRLRLATLGAYDGEEFRVASGDDGVRFVRLPGGVPAGGPEVSVTIGGGFTGIWLPMPAGVASAPDFTGPRAAALADGFYQDAASDSAIDVAARSGAAAGDADAYGAVPGDGYRVIAAPPDAASASSEFASAAGADSLVSAAAHPELAEWVAAQEVPRTGSGLADLIDRLRARGYLSHSLTETDAAAGWIADLEGRADYAFLNSYSGHSTARIEALFSDLNDQQTRAGEDAPDEALVAGVGDDEQFSVAAALLARFLGFESRVVLGVRLSSDDPDLGVEPCDTSCTGANLTAWTEVRSPNGGWVTFDVTPQFTDTPVIITEGEQLPDNPTVPDEVESELLDPTQAQRDDTEAPQSDPPADLTWLETLLVIVGRVGLGLLTAVLLVLPALVLVIAKIVRRRQRRASPVPESRMVGAWSELVDTYLDYGLEVPERVTRSAVAEAVDRPRAAALATLVDHAVFAEHPPGRTASDETWRLVDEERRDLAAEMPRGRRLRALVAPASFVRGLPSLTPATWFAALRRKDA